MVSDNVLPYARRVAKRRMNIAAIVIGALVATLPTFMLWKLVTYLFVVPLFAGLIIIVVGFIEARRRALIFAVVFGSIALIVPFALIAEASRSGPPVHFVIPDGFRGVFKLVFDRGKGQVVTLRNGRFTYAIPQSGVLIVNSDRPFRRWHSESASFVNGTRISSENEISTSPVALHALSSGVRSSGGVEEYFQSWLIGTELEKRATYGKTNLPLGGVVKDK